MSQGALERRPEGLALTAAGRARALREAERAPERAFRAQHEAGGPGAAGPGCAGLRRLAQTGWLSRAELQAGERLHADHEAGRRDRLRGVDWSAPPGAGARGPAAEVPALMGLDARRRVERALAALAPPLAETVRRLVLAEEGLEAVERALNWPPRSGRVAARLALAQLALHYGLIRS